LFLALVLTTGVGIPLSLFVKGIDRKITAHMQGRIGPPLRQPFLDIRKLLGKDSVKPENAVNWLYELAPVIGFVSALLLLFYVPYGSFGQVLWGGGDLILFAYLLLIPSLAMVLGGFASGSPYSSVGAQREMVTMLSYEFPVVIGIVSMAWAMFQFNPGVQTSFDLTNFSFYPVWNLTKSPLGLLGMVLILFVFVLVTTAELTKIPFDVGEAETEIAGGVLAEYSGRNLALFYLGDCVKSLAMGALVVAIFFPYPLSPVLGIEGYPGLVLDLLFFIAKTLLVLLFSLMLVRVSVARLKINQVVDVQWFTFSLLCLMGLLLIWLDIWFGDIIPINLSLAGG
jgi:formate hydrogenlyase subunit 4